MPLCTEAAAYLRGYAEPEARCPALGESFPHVVVVPSCGEGEHVLGALQTVCARALAILVVNGRRDADAWVHARNAATLQAVAAAWGEGTPMAPGIWQCRAPWGALVVVDRASVGRRFPPKQGVGLARKIGVDMALSFMVRGAIEGRWIHTTDADVRLPTDYFARTASLMGQAAAVYPFVHVAQADPALAEAMARYEASLHAYVRGLVEAGSPYAFHTIGSTIAVDAGAYAQVRGFPRRDAAEDFYLLDKLRKIGPVANLGGDPIAIAGRVSQRVPFGTGKALWRMVTQEAAPPTYHPEAFERLRAWLGVLERAAIDDAGLREACDAAAAPGLLWRLAEAIGAPAAIRLAHLKTRSPATRARYLHTWFDAFRTLRFVRLCHAELTCEERP